MDREELIHSTATDYEESNGFEYYNFVVRTKKLLNPSNKDLVVLLANKGVSEDTAVNLIYYIDNINMFNN